MELNCIDKLINTFIVHAHYNTLKTFAKTLYDINNECLNFQLNLLICNLFIFSFGHELKSYFYSHNPRAIPALQ